MNRNLLLAVIALGLLSSSPAFARKARREGFNFGTTVRLLSTDDRTNAGIGSDKDTHHKSSSQLINPYMGYSFDSFNLGLVLSAEQASSQIVEEDEDGLTKQVRTSEMSGKGLSLFGRFLFGEVFFFEAAGGLYQQILDVKLETKNLAEGGAFTGSEDSYQVKGVGPGYHLGAGLELPMGGGFFFTSAYQVRMVQLRDLKGRSDLGAKRSFQQKREVLFGIAHYHR